MSAHHCTDSAERGIFASVNALSSEGNLLDNVGSAEHGCPFLLIPLHLYGK